MLWYQKKMVLFNTAAVPIVCPYCSDSPTRYIIAAMWMSICSDCNCAAERTNRDSREERGHTPAFSCVTFWFLLFSGVRLKVAVSFSGLSHKSAFHQILCACEQFWSLLMVTWTRDVTFPLQVIIRLHLFILSLVMWFLKFHVFLLIWFCFYRNLIHWNYLSLWDMKGLHNETFSSFYVSLSHECRPHPCSSHNSFSFLTFLSPTSQSLFPYTHRLSPSTPQHSCLLETPLITLFCFLKQTLRPGRCRAARFSAGVITVSSTRPPGAGQQSPDQPGTIDRCS